MSENFSSQEAASWWTRGKAAIVDFLIFIAACLIPGVLIVTSFVIAYDDFWQEFDFSGGSITLLVLGILLGIVALVWSGWFFGYCQGVSGTTPGKRSQGICLVDAESGKVPGGARGVGRWLVPGLIGSVAQGIGNAIQLIDLLWPIWDPKKQRLIDKVFKTRVVLGIPISDEGSEIKPNNPIS